MGRLINTVVHETVGTTAKDIDCGYRDVYIANAGATTLYIKEKSKDGKSVTAATGWALPAGTSMLFPISVKTLSVVSSAASGDIRVMMLE